MLQLDWQAGIYFDTTIGPYLPCWNVNKAIIEGARLSKGGASVERAFQTTDVIAPLLYKGPRDQDGLWADPAFRDIRSVKIGQARTMRCRPIFKKWSVQIEAFFHEAYLNEDDLERYVKQAGRLVGLGDGRKMGFGRFDMEMVTSPSAVEA